MQRMSTHFWLFEDKRLYRESYSGQYLLCLHPGKTAELLTELHEGVCGGHLEGGPLHIEP